VAFEPGAGDFTNPYICNLCGEPAGFEGLRRWACAISFSAAKKAGEGEHWMPSAFDLFSS
jgi:hypothetical protein